MNFEVTEKPSGIFSIGGGYSSADSFVGTIDLAQNNFLGRGYQASIRIRAGELTQQGVISFTDPWLFDMPLAGGFDLFSLQRDYTEYTYASLGGTLRLSKPFEEFWRATASYRLSRDTVSGHQFGGHPRAAGPGGHHHHLDGVEGGWSATAATARPSPQQGRAILAERRLRRAGRATIVSSSWWGASRISSPSGSTTSSPGALEAGYPRRDGAGQESPLFERFFLGGPNSLRGWKFRQISPRRLERPADGGQQSKSSATWST